MPSSIFSFLYKVEAFNVISQVMPYLFTLHFGLTSF